MATTAELECWRTEKALDILNIAPLLHHSITPLQDRDLGIYLVP